MQVSRKAKKHQIIKPVPFVRIPIFKQEMAKELVRRIIRAKEGCKFKNPTSPLSVIAFDVEAVIGCKGKLWRVLVINKQLILVFLLNCGAFRDLAIILFKVYI